jgi:hypothetical protein
MSSLLPHVLCVTSPAAPLHPFLPAGCPLSKVRHFCKQLPVLNSFESGATLRTLLVRIGLGEGGM